MAGSNKFKNMYYELDQSIPDDLRNPLEEKRRKEGEERI